MRLIHNLAHRLQEAAGRRVCVLCGCLTGNRFRPVGFSLPKSGGGMAQRSQSTRERVGVSCDRHGI